MSVSVFVNFISAVLFYHAQLHWGVSAGGTVEFDADRMSPLQRDLLNDAANKTRLNKLLTAPPAH